MSEDITSSNEVLHKRVGHITVSYKHFILVWGGFMSNERDQEVYCPTDHIWFYNCLTEVWTLGHTTGDLPFKNSGSTAVVCQDCLYIYGGVEELTGGDLWRYSCELHCLNLNTLKWSHILPIGVPPHGCDKGVGWVYGKKIYFFGGYGQKSVSHLGEEYSFVPDGSNLQGNRGWNNVLTCFDPNSNTWSIPRTYGFIPPPRAAHAADVSGDRVYVFGGRTEPGRVNDFYFLDMITMTWSIIYITTGLSDIPEKRSWHSFNFISRNCAVVYGGLGADSNPSKDWWLCKVKDTEATWHRMGEMRHNLVWHKATICSSTSELIIVGGVTCSPYIMQEGNHVNTIITIPFSPASLLRLSLNTILKNDLQEESDLPKCLLDILIARKVQTRIKLS